MARIAWIEDDHDRISSLVRLLERDEHTILPYSSWQEVKEQIETICACDAIILDIILPPIEDDPYLGLSVLNQLREEHGYQGPVVVCSRVKNPVVLNELQELGVTEILRKPVRPSVLYDVVTKAIESVTS
jgi:Response regulators consisting of a CheY-like receiver domain and a winged-helix DNA-binding domain